MLQETPKRIYLVTLVVSWLFFFVVLIILLSMSDTKDVVLAPHDAGNITERAKNQHPPTTSNESLNGDKTHFIFSPDKKHIAFIQNVWEEFGNDWDRYWALKILDVATREEKMLLVDDSKMSSYEWQSATTIRVFHNAGTGVRGYRDVRVDIEEPIFFKDYKDSDRHTYFWQLDEEYTREAREAQLAREAYYARE